MFYEEVRVRGRFSRVGTGARTHARTGRGRGVSACVRTGAYARVLNSNSININTSVCETSAAEAVTHTQPISLGGLFRQLPKRVPESYALWWWRSMKERFFGKAFPWQEETAAEEWEEKCRGRRDLIFDK